jgi:cytochrome c oxidase subunit 3/cytochrome o ubiquinol oxidase subunit 3
MSEATIGHGHHQSAEAVALSNDNQKFAMWLYLASEVVIFTVLIGGYALFRVNKADVVKDVHHELGLGLVSFNTFLLLASSWAMVMGLLHGRRGDRQGLIRWISLTALLGAVFVVLQYVEYSELAHLGISLGYQQGIFQDFGMRFYAPTAFHGAHVIVGVLWALLVIYRARDGRYDHNTIGVEIFGLYWHFVDVVWIILFTLIYLI